MDIAIQSLLISDHNVDLFMTFKRYRCVLLDQTLGVPECLVQICHCFVHSQGESLNFCRYEKCTIVCIRIFSLCLAWQQILIS